MIGGYDDYYDNEHIEEYTYEELYAEVDRWWNSLNEDAQYRWNMNPSPTYDMTVLTDIKEGDSVRINYDKPTYEIMKKTYNNITEVLDSSEFKEFIKNRKSVGINFLDEVLSKGIPGNKISMISGKSDLDKIVKEFLESQDE